MPKVAWLLGSLAPATACVLLTFSAFNHENPRKFFDRAVYVLGFLGFVIQSKVRPQLPASLNLFV